MKKILLFIFVLGLSINANADEPFEFSMDIFSQNTVGASSQGYEFLIAIPPNETSLFAMSGDIVFFVSSTKPTRVELRNPITNALIKSKLIDNNFGVVTFGNRPPYGNELVIARDEIRLPETPVEQVFRIVSYENPVSVYVLNSKNTTSDGYMAIPTSSWGIDYIHCSYYDKNESNSAKDQDMHWFGAGFVVISSQDDTEIDIFLKGVGGQFAGTTSGKKPGDTISITLDRGQAYMVRGDGSTVGSFDLTGSRVVSDKPIGLISYHQRTDIPSLIGSSRDHLVEMIPPVTALGKTYATVELKRNDRGDLFRIVASEDSTNYNVIWYDKTTSDILGSQEGVLVNSGDFVDIIDHMTAPTPNINSVRGMSVFNADKPILLMQYSYSAAWDANSQYDPFMVLVSPIEQFTKATVFQTPGKEFSNNLFNIIAIGDSSNTAVNDSLLESIFIDGEPLYIIEPDFKTNRIPGTNLFWATLQVAVGPHYVVGGTNFGGYIYGFTSVDSYGWPAAMAVNDLSLGDTNPPIINVVEVNSLTYNVSFHKNDETNTAGVSMQPTLLPNSINFMEPKFDSEFTPYPPKMQGQFTVEVFDPAQDAIAFISVMDRAGNETIEIIEYEGFVSVEDNHRNELSIYPIPANDFISINYSNSEQFNALKIIDIFGKTVKTISYNDFNSFNGKIDVSNLPQGTYFIIIENNSQILKSKFNISR